MSSPLTLVCYQGATFGPIYLSWQPGGVVADLSNWTAQLDVRDVSNNLIVSLTTDNKRITLGNFPLTTTTGDIVCNIKLFIAAEDTQDLTLGKHRYDLTITCPETDSTPAVIRHLLPAGVEEEAIFWVHEMTIQPPPP